ncbi:MAG: hypothetical protein ACYSSO_11705 [Planctomycetota bacterium]|jgi:hypothetical protein
MTEIEVTKEQFLEMPQSEQGWIVLQTLKEQINVCDGRFCAIEGTVNGTNGDGHKGKIKAILVQLKVQWALFLAVFGLIAWVLRS